MKKMMLFVLAAMVMGLGSATAQTENTFEGEITANLHSVQKMKSQVTTKNILAKMILKKVMKKHVDNNPNNYTGVYSATTIAKGNKTRVNTPYNNSVTITEKDGDTQKMTVYYPYIKKGYYTVTDMKKNEKQLEEMRKGEVIKTGETMDILGYKCEIYKMKYEMKTDTAGMVSTMIMDNAFAVCTDPSLPGSDQEVPLLPDVKGVPLKYINNTVSQTTSEMLNLDILMYLSSVTTSITPRTVDDSEFEIPADVKLIDGDKDVAKLGKLIEENTKYMKKKGLWVDTEPDEVKIYDNLQEEWDY